MHYKYIILGAGPSGLTHAHALIENGVSKNDILVLEKNETPGGLCRSEIVDGTPLDIGGGHFLDIKKKNVLDFVFRFLPENEWNTFNRISKIRLRGQEIDHPLEANLWQLSKSDQVDYLESIARAGCIREENMPEAFADWITWKLGDRIANEYMLPYNKKIWSMDPNKLGTYWLYKLPDVSFRDTLRSCLEGSPHGALPAHGKFLYPKEHGYGELWQRMGRSLGSALITNFSIEKIDLETKTINDQLSADTIISTIPWHSWNKFCVIPEEIKKNINSLVNIPIDIDYVPETLNNQSHWIYEPDESIPHHRLLLRSNFCTNSKGYWTETNAARSKEPTDWRHHNEYAYPVNTLKKPESIKIIMDWFAKHGIIGAGRWGKWEHMNSDIVVDEALTTVSKYIREGKWT